MARPERNNVDYFPFYCEDGQKMFYIEQQYGNDGFATFIKILRELAKKDYHFLHLDKASEMFLSAKCKVSVEVLNSIINDLVELNKFDRDLWQYKVIWCQDFIDSIQDAYSKRNNKCITYEGLRVLLSSKGILKPSKPQTKGGRKPQSIEEYSIEEESKEENNKEEQIFIDAFNDCFGKNFTLTNSRKKEISKIIKQGYTVEDAKAVFFLKSTQWKNKPDMRQFLTPDTLLRFTNFEKYVDEVRNVNIEDLNKLDGTIKPNGKMSVFDPNFTAEINNWLNETYGNGTD